MHHATPMRHPEPFDPAEVPLPLAGDDAPRPVHRPAASPPPQASTGSAGGSKIRAFTQSLGTDRHESEWSRTPNTTGTGAIHCKTFHCKLTGESLEFLDRQINEWLDAHPQYEVKFVSTSVGDWTGKIREPNLIVQVWV